VKTYSLFGHIPVGSDQSLCEFTLFTYRSHCNRFYNILKLSFDTSFVVTGKLYHFHQSGSESSYYLGRWACTGTSKRGILIDSIITQIHPNRIYIQSAFCRYFIRYILATISQSSWPVKLT